MYNYSGQYTAQVTEDTALSFTVYTLHFTIFVQSKNSEQYT